jgi:hypothetical protein
MLHSGTFVQDKFEGEGVYTYPNGDLYVGPWAAGRKHGQGMYNFKVCTSPRQ